MSLEDQFRSLTSDELLVLKYRCDGLNISQIASTLKYNTDWVQSRMGGVYKKLGLNKQMGWTKRVKMLETIVCPALNKYLDVQGEKVRSLADTKAETSGEVGAGKESFEQKEMVALVIYDEKMAAHEPIKAARINKGFQKIGFILLTAFAVIVLIYILPVLYKKPAQVPVQTQKINYVVVEPTNTYQSPIQDNTAAPTENIVYATATVNSSVTEESIIANAENNIQDFKYLSSPEYLNYLIDKDVKGELPQVPNDVFYAKAGYIELAFDKEPSLSLKDVGVDGAIFFADHKKWQLKEKQPWRVVDAGKSNIGGTDIGFFTLKWVNPDKSVAFWGFTFVSLKAPSTKYSLSNRIKSMSGYDLRGYPTPMYYSSVKGCISYTTKYINENNNGYCNLMGTNPESALPKDALRKWNETGILDFNTKIIPWSEGGSANLYP